MKSDKKIKTTKRGKKQKFHYTKKILDRLLGIGDVFVIAVQPRVNVTLWSELSRYDKVENRPRRENRKFYNAFYSLKRRGLIHIDYHGQQMYISLTAEGKKLAGKYKIDDLKIKKPKKWDKKWRIFIFDIADKQKTKREALRGKLKELAFFLLQKSVWVYPYDFKKEIQLLREFFGLADSEMKVITASEIENDGLIRDYFKLS